MDPATTATALPVYPFLKSKDIYNIEFEEDFSYLSSMFHADPFMLDLIQEMHEEFLIKKVFTTPVRAPSPPPFMPPPSVQASTPATTICPSPQPVPASSPTAAISPSPVATVPLVVGFQAARLAPGRQAARLVAWAAPKSPESAAGAQPPELPESAAGAQPPELPESAARAQPSPEPELPEPAAGAQPSPEP
ncbi:vegetative cell wall protein gp1-like [Poecilia latipinna]|uniref:vegetative cell wall protein gp1-like n=1 Tax=Poecilia latipinna TaxID=48699 RepID=UPI00072ED810|nr:PREDICTED: vegetative cell wall protein gp1-like [Poecilia latipinna]